MSKSFFITLIISLVALGIFVYFIFGLYPQSPAAETPNSQSLEKTTPTSTEKITIEDLTPGEGPEVKSGDTVRIHYTGTLVNGTKFDSSYDHGSEPFETQIGVGRVIKGWDEGVVGMKVGGKRKLIIPPSLGYGAQDMGTIPPNSTLIFELELVEIK